MTAHLPTSSPPETGHLSKSRSPSGIHSPSRAPRRRRRRTAWIGMTVLATLTAAVSTRYFTLDPRLFLTQQRTVYLAHLVPLLLHVGGGVLALALGPWQFAPRLRRRRPAAHRAIGRIYLLSAVAAGLGGLLLVPVGLYWPIAPLGFAALAVALLFASGRAFVTIRRGAITEHRIWVTRSYALIFSAVTFRLWLVVLPGVGLSFSDAYRSGAWLSWLINMLVAQLLIARTRVRDTARDAARDAAR